MKINNSNRILCESSRCIYCGSTEDLRKEHIIPNGLNGYWIINKGSCKMCADITSKFEREVLRDSMITARKFLGLRSYRKKRQPNIFPMIIEEDGEIKEINVSIDKYPSLILFPTNKNIVAIQLNSMGSLMNIYRDNIINVKYRLNGKSFARMLAKIAYGFSVVHFGIENFKDIYVVPSILGEKDDIDLWVSCIDENIKLKEEKCLHNIIIETIGYDVVVKIKLFAIYPVPEYKVVVGRLNEENKNIM